MTWRISIRAPGTRPYPASTSASTSARDSSRPSGAASVKAGAWAPANPAKASRGAVPASQRSMSW